MPKQSFLKGLLLWTALIALLFLAACSTTYEGDDFKFSAPFGFKTKEFKPAHTDSSRNSESLLFSQSGRLYFQIFRQKIPDGSDLNAVFTAYAAKISAVVTHYQLISQNKIKFNERDAIEYVHREFLGEPYTQSREIWVEYNGWIYTLVCVEPVDSTDGKVIPVADECIELANGFQFKQP